MNANEDKLRCPEPEDILAMIRCELEPQAEERVKAHTDFCDTCGSIAEELVNTVRALEHDEDASVSQDLAPLVLADIGSPTPVQWNAPVVFRAVVRLAACALLVVGAVLAVQYLQDVGHVEDPVAQKSTAVRQGLEWLVAIQEPSGKWDADRWGGRREYTVGLTGMSLLSLVRNTEDFPGRDESIKKAVSFLLKQQRENGSLGDDFDGTMYNHGIASTALMEAHASDPALVPEEPLRRMLSYISNQQLTNGGWGYEKRREAEANTCISCWPLQALLVSAELGWEDDMVPLRRGLRWMASVVDDSGLFGYQQASKLPKGPNALTAMGAYCLFRADKGGMGVDESVMAHVRSAVRKLSEKESDGDFYRTYFHVGALEELGGNSADEARFDKFHSNLLARRQADGPNKGTWDPADQWGPVGGRIYSTAMATMALCAGI